MKLNNPVFKPVPKSHLADVKENIDNFLDNNKTGNLESLCLKATGPGSHRGYRFKRSEDLTETVITDEKWKRIEFKMKHTIYYKPYSSLDPLHFIPYLVKSVVMLPNGEIPFTTKAQLKRDINDYIQSKL